MIARGLLAAGGGGARRSPSSCRGSRGTSGWEHWAWADVILAALALALIAAAVRPPPAPLRIALVVLCGLGIAVVLGHGFEPRTPATKGSADVHIGPYLALAALAAATIGLLAAWPSAGSVALLVAAAAGLVAALFSDWGREGDYNGFERWHVLDVALLALALGLLVAAAGKAPRALRWLLALGALAAAACVLAASDTQIWIGDGGTAEGAAPGCPRRVAFAHGSGRGAGPSSARRSGHSVQRRHRRRVADEETLAVVDAEVAHDLERGLVLDPLGDGDEVERAGEVHDRLDHRARAAVARHVAHELPVDLDDAERQVLEVGEAAVAGAEVVEGQAAAELR